MQQIKLEIGDRVRITTEVVRYHGRPLFVANEIGYIVEVWGRPAHAFVVELASGDRPAVRADDVEYVSPSSR